MMEYFVFTICVLGFGIMCVCIIASIDAEEKSMSIGFIFFALFLLFETEFMFWQRGLEVTTITVQPQEIIQEEK